MKRQAGISLIELMISLFLATIIMTLLVKQYISSKIQYKASQSTLMNAYDLVQITDLLRTSARQAGFTPCVGIGWLKTRDGRNKPGSLKAIETNSGPHHALYIARMSERFAAVSNIFSPRGLVVEADYPVLINQDILIADCFHAEVNTIAGIKRETKQWTISLKYPLLFHYTQPVYLGEWLEEAFYVDKNSRGQPALFYQRRRSEELSSRVRSLTSQLIYKQKTMLLRVNLGLDTKEWLVETALRVP